MLINTTLPQQRPVSYYESGRAFFYSFLKQQPVLPKVRKANECDTLALIALGAKINLADVTYERTLIFQSDAEIYDNSPTERGTPLHNASLYGNKVLSLMLKQLGAHVNASDNIVKNVLQRTN